ncbi:unnamed protein product [Cuscuta epithymum]|uniref:Uncharacterized protein n=1 Tax=Cuscuta epithymum TaxID=186058 RepID=A0AAV0G4N9_9ASTE|nr:unnamed protein product [Cuscuta epithymum]
MATTVLCSTIGPSAPSYPAHVRLVHPFQGWRRTSYASRSAPQRHRVLIHGSDRPFPSRMATTVLCSTIGPSAPSYPAHVRLVHPFQGGDERLMHHDRPPQRHRVLIHGSDRASLPGWRRTSYAVRSAPQRHRTWLHGSARTFPPGWRRPSYAARSAPQRHRVSFTFGSRISSRMATNVLCSAIGPSAPSYLASRFGSHIPFRMATTVLCSTIGPSAPSCLFHVRIMHPLQDGDERLICSTISAPAPSCLARVRLAHPFQDGDEHLLYSSIGPSAASCLVHLRLRPCHLGWGTRRMQHDWPLGGIMSSPPSAPPMPSRMGDPSYAARLLLGADMPGLSMRATASITSCIPSLIHYIHTLHAYIHSCIIPHTSIHTHVHHVLTVPRRRFIDDGPLSFSDWKARVRVLYSRLMHSGGVCPWRSTLRPTLSRRGVPHW